MKIIKDNLKLVFVSLFALLLRLPGIFRVQSIIDENRALEFAKISWAEFQNLVTQTTHPPLYFYLIRLWGSISGNLPFLRILSLILGVLTCVVVFKLTEYLFNKRAAVMAGYIFAISPQLVFISQYLRPYALATLLFAIYLFLMFTFINSVKIKTSYILALCLGLNTFALMYTYYFSFFLLLPATIFTTLIVFKEPKKLWLFCFCQLFAAILFLHWIPKYMLQMQNVATGMGSSTPLLTTHKMGFYLGSLHMGGYAKLFAGLLQFEDIVGQMIRFSTVVPKPLLLLIMLALLSLVILLLKLAIRAAKHLQRHNKTTIYLVSLYISAIVLLALILIAGDFGIGQAVHMNMKYVCQFSIIFVIFAGVFLAGLSDKKRLAIIVAVSIFYLPQVIYINSYPMNIHRKARSFTEDHKAGVYIVCPEKPSWLDEKYEIWEYADIKDKEQLLEKAARAKNVGVIYLKTAENLIRYNKILNELIGDLRDKNFFVDGFKNINDQIVFWYFTKD